MEGLFLERLGEGSQMGRFAGPGPREYIYLGLCELVERAKPLQMRKLHSLSIAVGTERYELPADFLAYQDINEPITIAGRKMVPLAQGDVEQMRDNPCESWVNTSSVGWYEAGVSDVADSTFGKRYIGFWPIPIAAATAKIPYVRKPISLDHASLTSVMEYPDVPVAYHRAPVYFGLAEYWSDEGDEAKAQVWLGKFELLATRYATRVAEEMQACARPRIRNELAGAIESWMPV